MTISAGLGPQPSRPPPSALSWVHGAQEFLWLLVVFGVPCVFLSRADVLSSPVIVFVEIPKIALLRTVAAAMAALWMAEWVLGGWAADTRSTHGGNTWIWLKRLVTPMGLRNFSPRGSVVVAVGIFFAVVLITALLSASVGISF